MLPPAACFPAPSCPASLSPLLPLISFAGGGRCNAERPSRAPGRPRRAPPPLARFRCVHDTAPRRLRCVPHVQLRDEGAVDLIFMPKDEEGEYSLVDLQAGRFLSCTLLPEAEEGRATVGGDALPRPLPARLPCGATLQYVACMQGPVDGGGSEGGSEGGWEDDALADEDYDDFSDDGFPDDFDFDQF